MIDCSCKIFSLGMYPILILALFSLSSIEKPLKPYGVVLNITTEGYILRWKTKIVPGRPMASKFAILYRDQGSEGAFKELRLLDVANAAKSRRRRRRRSIDNSLYGLTVQQNELGTDVVQEFRIAAVSSDGIQSKTNKPAVNFLGKKSSTTYPISSFHIFFWSCLLIFEGLDDFI